MSLSRQFYAALVFSSLIKIGLSVLLPFTGDEAYHFVWGKYLDFGYYDHPPLIGWLMHLLQYLGESRFLLRLPTVIFGIIIGLVIYHFIKKRDKTKAQMVSILFWLSPFNLLNVIITNDAPLIILTFLSGWFFILGFEKKHFLYFLFSGLFLGLAFASKYFALLLAAAFLGYVLFFQRNRKGFGAILCAFMPASVFVLMNGYWNYTHCWDNIVFNFFIRHTQPPQFNPVNFVLFLLGQIYLITPVVFYYWVKDRKSIRGNLAFENSLPIPLVFYGIPMFFLALISFFKSIGLHWTLSFIPFVFMGLFVLFSAEILKKMIRPMILFSAVHLLMVGVVLVLFHTGRLNHLRLYQDTLISIKAREISSLLKPFQNDFELAAESYDDVSMLYFFSGKKIFQFGKGSQRGRQFDKWTDFKKLQNKNILIVRGGSPREEYFNQFFERIEIKENRISEYPLFLIFGYRFKYEVYKETVLREILDSYYSIPPWLPCGECYFKDHYFGGE